MAFDTIEGVREYRRQLDYAVDADNPPAVVGMAPHTMALMLDTLLDEIDRLTAGTPPERTMESVEILPLDKRRRLRIVDEAPDLE